MAEITKVQMKILEDLYKRDVENELHIRIQPEFYDLDESDVIMQIRELVFHIDHMINLDMISAKEHYYIESDSVSINYLNNAIEIQDRRIKLSDLGIAYIEALKKDFINRFNDRITHNSNQIFTDHPYRVIGSHLSTFIIGALGMWIYLNIF